jgi:hypothetical protein
VNITIENQSEVPTVSADAGAYLAVYNYSVQRFVSRSIKFITAYYDFIGGMINSAASSDVTSDQEVCCGGDPNAARPSPAYPSAVKDRVFQAWQWVWERMELSGVDLFCEPDCLLQPILTLLTLGGGDNASAFRNVLLKKSLNSTMGDVGCTQPSQYNPCCNDKSSCAVTIGTQGAGRDYDVSQFQAWGDQVISVIEIMENILSSLDMTNDPLSAEQVLEKICDCYIKCACCDNADSAPGGKTNGICDDTILHCYNRCGQPYNGRQVITPDCTTALIVRNTYGACNSCLDCDWKYRPHDLTNINCGQGPRVRLSDTPVDPCCDQAQNQNEAGECCLPADLPCGDEGCTPLNGRLYIPSTRERLQAAIFVLDWVAFLLFDRDADKSQFKDTNIFTDGNCFCPDWEGESPCLDCCDGPMTSERWLKTRCKLGTGNGSCVVAAGACKKFRQVDDYKPMQTMIISLKHFIKLLTLPTDAGYQAQVTDTYNNLLSSLHDVYLGEDELNFKQDCAAPQFCCTTKWTQAGRLWGGVRQFKSSQLSGPNREYCTNPCACCNLTVPEYTVQCFARLKCSCIGPSCEVCAPPVSCGSSSLGVTHFGAQPVGQYSGCSES